MARIGRPTKEEFDRRRSKLVGFYSDMMEGNYPWPDGKKREPGFINQQECLRAAEYAATYKDGYKIFKRPDFQKAVTAELDRRRLDRLQEEMPDAEQLDKMKKLANLEILDRLEHRPGSISAKDLVMIRMAVDKLLESDKPPKEGGSKRFPGIRIDQLVVSLDGLVPAASISAVKERVGIPEQTEPRSDYDIP